MGLCIWDRGSRICHAKNCKKYTYIKECSVCTSKIHYVRPIWWIKQISKYTIFQFKCIRLTHASEGNSFRAFVLLLPYLLRQHAISLLLIYLPDNKGKRNLNESPKQHKWLIKTFAEIDLYRYWRTACCLLQDGWSVGMSATLLSLPKR